MLVAACRVKPILSSQALLLGTEASIKVPQPPAAGNAGSTLLARWVDVYAIPALVPAFAIGHSYGDWDNPVLFISLTAIALVSLWGLVAIRPSVFLDAEFVAVLLALLLLGALPAACVWLAAEGIYLVLSRRPIEAHLANIASYGWAVLSGALVLSLLGRGYASLALAAVVMLMVNFTVARGIVGGILNGQPMRAVVHEELIRPAPATLLMVGVGVLTAFLYVHIGVLALALFALTVMIPQYLLPVLLRPRPVGEVPYPEAVALYAKSIARMLKLERERHAILEDAATFLDIEVFHPVQGKLHNPSFEHWSGVQETLLFYREHWDAPGGVPGALSGELIPLTSRVLSVADVWARLTAAG